MVERGKDFCYACPEFCKRSWCPYAPKNNKEDDMKILTHDYTDIGFIGVKVRYKDERYVKFKGTLVNKNNGLVYETKNYKMDLDKWKRLEYK